MRMKLTDAALRALKPPAKGRTVITDTEREGLRVRITPKGKVSWLFQKQVKGGRRLGITLGSYPAMTLAQARAAAMEIQIEAERGVDRVEEAKAARAKAEKEVREARTTGDILELYIAGHIDQDLKPGPSREERKRQLRTYLTPHISVPIDALTRANLQKIVDTKQAEGKVVMANRLRAALSAFTGWAYRRGYIDQDVGSGVQKAGKETARRRTPTLAEVREIWDATFRCGDLWGPFFRLCILTGQRSRNEVLKMRWSWVDFDKHRYEIPDPKNGQPHIVHLTALALVELSALRARQKAIGFDTPFVFTTKGHTPASGVTKAKARLVAEIHKKRKAVALRDEMEHWVLHDLRRAQATALAEAGFDEGVVDRIQNHVAGGSRPSTVAAVYTRAQKLPERARALDAWAQMVLGDCNEWTDFGDLT